MKGEVSDPTTCGEARRFGDPGGAEETQRPGNTVGPCGQGGAAVTSGQGGARMQVD